MQRSERERRAQCPQLLHQNTTRSVASRRADLSSHSSGSQKIKTSLKRPELRHRRGRLLLEAAGRSPQLPQLLGAAAARPPSLPRLSRGLLLNLTLLPPSRKDPCDDIGSTLANPGKSHLKVSDLIPPGKSRMPNTGQSPQSWGQERASLEGVLSFCLRHPRGREEGNRPDLGCDQWHGGASAEPGLRASGRAREKRTLRPKAPHACATC